MTSAPPPDFPIETLLPILQRWIDQGGALCLTWLCPSCDERVISLTPNEYTPGRYRHERRHDGSKCGAEYTGTMFGVHVLFRPPGHHHSMS